MAKRHNVDLLLVDTGDRIEGNGLYDASYPKGNYTSEIFKHAPIDIITVGNHELYKRPSALAEFYKTVPNFKDAYLASNLDIKNPRTGDWQSLARRYKKFRTENLGVAVTAFGFIYNFDRNTENTRIEKVEDTVKEKWFQDAIRDEETDLFVVAGHVAADSNEYKAVFKAIREVRWDMPIHFFAGHTHIRDYKNYDQLASAIESGRYMETIGFASVDNLDIGRRGRGWLGAKLSPKFGRMYIDNNLFSLHHHSLSNDSTFDTQLGRNVSRQITDARKAMDLDDTFGCAPRDLWMNRADPESKDSIFSWLRDDVLPEELKGDHTRPKLVITNTGAIRFDIFRGRFTKDSNFLISPFTSGFRQIVHVRYEVARQVLDLLNNAGPILDGSHGGVDWTMLPPPMQVSLDRRAPRTANSPLYRRPDHRGQTPLRDEPDLTPGYTTVDDNGDDGDDTAHSKLPYHKVPNCIQSAVDFPRNTSAKALSWDFDEAIGADEEQQPKTVDLVYNEFLEKYIILALQHLGANYNETDTRTYAEGKSMTDVMSGWIKKHWRCPEDEAEL